MKVHIEQAKKLTRNPNTSASIIIQLAQIYLDRYQYIYYEEIATSIASNPNTPAEILKRLFISFPRQVLNNISIPLILLEKPHFFDDVNYIRYRFFDRAGIPYWFLEWAANHADYRIRAAVARGKGTPICLLTKLAQDPEIFVRAYVWFNRNCPLEILVQLSEESVRYESFRSVFIVER